MGCGCVHHGDGRNQERKELTKITHPGGSVVVGAYPCADPPVSGSLASGGHGMFQKIRKGVLVSALLLCGLTALLSSGCATTRGFGQDVQSLGRDIEKSGK